jgi:integrase
VSKEKSIKSRGYELRRYFTPASLTASQTPKMKKKRAQGPEVIPLTYLRLLEQQERDVQLLQANAQTAANRATALRTFLRANALHPEDVVGNEMRLLYPAAVDRMTRALTKEGRSTRNIGNTCSALRHFREAVVAYDTNQAILAEEPTPFVRALKSVLAASPIRQIARQVCIPHAMLCGWLLGKQPRPSNVGYITRLESFFGLEKDSLVSLAGAKFRNLKAKRSEVGTTIEYNKTVHALVQHQYCCRPEPGSVLQARWLEFLRYKTAAVPRLRRGRNGKWRFSPNPSMKPTSRNWWGFIDGKEIASAKVNWYRVSSYIGWLELDTELGGKGMPPEKAQTLAWLAVPDYIEEYLDWWKSRIGKRNRGTTIFLGLLGTLVRPRFGYLRQLNAMMSYLPKEYHSEDWDSLCERQFTLIEKLDSAFEGEIEVSRDSFEPIRKIIALPQPMEAAIDMVQRMRAARPINSPGKEAIWGRDLALVKLLLSNPLRRSNIAHLTWRADNTGQLYQRDDKSWWIRIPKKNFKNTKGAAGDSIYDVQLQESAWRDIERYIFEFRPKLIKFPTDLAFISRPMHTTTEHKPWFDFSHTIYRLTVRYIPQCTGFRAHAFRHLVATSILKAPGGTHKTAAKILNDRVATVERHYDGLTSNDGAEEMGRLLGHCFNRM